MTALDVQAVHALAGGGPAAGRLTKRRLALAVAGGLVATRVGGWPELLLALLGLAALLAAGVMPAHGRADRGGRPVSADSEAMARVLGRVADRLPVGAPGQQSGEDRA